jgi:hypothetical protein
MKKSKRLVVGHWYLVGWSDAAPAVALCVGASRAVMDASFYFPQPLGPRGRGNIDSIDSPDQVLKHLGRAAVPSVPRELRTFRLMKAK